MTLPTYRLPKEIERGSSGGPDFKTIIQESASGKEQRIQSWAKCRATYDIGYPILKSSDPLGNYQVVLAMFYAHLGRLHPFRFKAWNDYRGEDMPLDPGPGPTREADGTSTVYQLVMEYDPSLILLNVTGTLRYNRTIVLPIVSTIKIGLGGSNLDPSNFTVSPAGVVTFNTAPGAGVAINWTGEFDLPMRFDTDHLPVAMQMSDLMQISRVPIREVIGEF